MGPIDALAALTGTEVVVVNAAAALPHLIILAVKDDKLQQLAIQAAIVERIAHRRLQANLERLFLVAAHEPHVIAHEGVLELGAQVTVELVDVLHLEALTVGRIADDGTLLGDDGDIPEVAALQLDILVQSSALDVGARYGNGLALDVAAVDLVGELPLLAVVVIDFVKQLLVIVGPLLEGIMVTIDARSDIGGDERCLDQECARTAHGVNQVGLAIPAAQQDDTGRQHLVDGRVGLGNTPAALEQRVTAAVQRQGHLAARDVNIKTDFGIVQADARTLAVLVIEVVGDGILDTISDKT